MYWLWISSEVYILLSTDQSKIEIISEIWEIIGIYDEMTLDSPKSDSERIYFVCKKGDN